MDLATILPAALDGFEIQRDSTGLLPELQRFPASAEGQRVVQIGDDIVVTAMVNRFTTDAETRDSVEQFARVLFSDPTNLVPMDGLGDLSDDARGAVASRTQEAPGAIAMLAWSHETLRLDLSVSVLRPSVTELSLWQAFPRERFDAVSAGMAQRARIAST